MVIQESIGRVKSLINKTAAEAGRDPRSIRLLAVSKTMPLDKVQEVYSTGHRDFAENRIQEWQEKVVQLPEDCNWHLIGRIQTNKVKYLNPRVSLIHSLDRFSLLQELERQGALKEITWSTLIQINIAHDPNKAGLLENELEDFLEAASKCQYVKVRGLMTIGAFEASQDETRGYFRNLLQLRERFQEKAIPNVDLRELSMGMSRDFEIAIQEGSTIIRVGRQIFGDRN